MRLRWRSDRTRQDPLKMIQKPSRPAFGVRLIVDVVLRCRSLSSMVMSSSSEVVAVGSQPIKGRSQGKSRRQISKDVRLKLRTSNATFHYTEATTNTGPLSISQTPRWVKVRSHYPTCTLVPFANQFPGTDKLYVRRRLPAQPHEDLANTASRLPTASGLAQMPSAHQLAQMRAKAA